MDERLCSICYENSDESILQFKCGHFFCQDCKDDLILRDPTDKNIQPSCPLCVKDNPDESLNKKSSTERNPNDKAADISQTSLAGKTICSNLTNQPDENDNTKETKGSRAEWDE